MALLFPRLSFADERVALRVDDESISYRALAALAACFASQLEQQGIRSGQRVAIYTDVEVATIAAMIGSFAAGVSVVPLNPKLGNKEREHILRDSTPAQVFSATQRDGATLLALEDRGEALPRREGDEDELLVLYTSGTTGLPKGAQITARGVAANIDGLARAWQWSDRDTVVHALPLFHVHGLVLGLLGSLRVGGALWTMRRFDTEAVADAMAAEGTMLFAVPTMHHRLAEAAEVDGSIGERLGKARLLISGSAGLPVREHRRMQKLTGLGVHERYGLTETLINCAVPASRSPMPGTVGFPLEGVELRLVDDARKVVHGSGDTIAEVAVRGASLFAGYLNRPDATADAMCVLDGEGDAPWFLTGDLATRDDEGAIRLVGRRSVDLIKTGGYKVGAGEVEACLLEDASVAECAVVGIEDEDLGQRIEAFVVLREGTSLNEEALIERVASELTPHKRPRAVHAVDALPRNAMGKVQKKKLLPGH